MASRRFYPGAAALLMLLGVAACDDGSDARTELLTPGISRAEAVAILQGGSAMAPAATADSLTNIWQAARYLMEGQEIEVIWYSRNNERRTAADTVPEDKVFPVALVNGKLVGAGRGVYDSLATRFKLPRNKY